MALSFLKKSPAKKLTMAESHDSEAQASLPCAIATNVVSLANKVKLSSIDVVQKLYDWGIYCVPVGFEKKSPSLSDWPNLKIGPDKFSEHFSGQTNVGVLNGSPSGDLVDIDIDSDDCRPFFGWLPETGMTSGREGNPRSHYFYRSPVATTPFKDEQGAMVLEVRSTGSQTVIPPSAHPSGDTYVWYSFEPPAAVVGENLLRIVSKIAAAVLVRRHWVEGGRHAMALALAGVLLRNNWKEGEAIEFIKIIAKAKNDTEWEDRVACVKSTAAKLAAGEPVTGIPTLSKHLGDSATKLVIKWLELGQHDPHWPEIERLNKCHAVVGVGGQVCILTEGLDHRGHPNVQYGNTADLRTRYANQRVVVAGLLGRKREVTIADLWLEHPDRRSYDGIVFAPDGAPPQFFNLFRGFPVEPIAGSCNLYLEHVKGNICQGNAIYYEYLLSWMAHAIQCPGELPEVAIVFRGAQGTGKGVATGEFGKLFGQHYIHLNNMEQLVGRFTGHLSDKVLVYANEALWGGNKASEGALKAMISDREAVVERKGRDIVRVDNYKRVMISSNEDWPVPVAKDDRRFFILDVSSDHKEDTAYFSAIHKQMREGGSQALMYLLKNRDLHGFEVRKVPHTPYSFHLKLQSMNAAEQFIYEKLRDSSKDTWEEQIEKKEFHSAYVTWCNDHGHKHPKTDAMFGKCLKQLIPSLDTSTKKTKEYSGGKKERTPMYVFPSLSVCRSEFEGVCKADSDIWSL